MKEVMNKINNCRYFQNSLTSLSDRLVLNLGNRTFFFIGFCFHFTTTSISMSSTSPTKSSCPAPRSTMKEGGSSSS
jgi:hypothetical protein